MKQKLEVIKEVTKEVTKELTFIQSTHRVLEYWTNEEGLKQFHDAVKKELEGMVKPKSNKEYSDKMKKYLEERKKK